MARIKDDYRALSGTEKAAIFLLSLHQDQAAMLFERMDDEEIRELSAAMSSLGNVHSSVIERLFVEFADKLSSAGGLVGSIDAAERLLNAALSGELINVPARIDPVFGFAVPLAVEGVDSKLLTPRETWEDKAAYDRQSARLVSLFEANFEKFAAADAQIAEAGPRLAVAAE